MKWFGSSKFVISDVRAGYKRKSVPSWRNRVQWGGKARAIMTAGAQLEIRTRTEGGPPSLPVSFSPLQSSVWSSLSVVFRVESVSSSLPSAFLPLSGPCSCEGWSSEGQPPGAVSELRRGGASGGTKSVGVAGQQKGAIFHPPFA